MSKKILKIWNTVTTVLVSVVAVAVLLLVALRLFGLKGYVVLSGSMEPTYKTGSVIYVKPADADALEEGQVITYRLTGTTIATHRIVEVVQEDGQRLYRTKGDANEHADGSLVSPDVIIGTPVFSVPYMGFALSYIQSAQGRYVAFAAGAFLLLLIFLPSLLFDKGDSKKKSINKEEEQ